MNHSTLIAIRGKISKLDNPNSSFKYASFDQKLKELEKLDPKKTSQLNDSPVKVIKENKDIVAFFIYHNFNKSLTNSTFPTALKYEDVKPAFKKNVKTDKENYRPISILPTLSTRYMKDVYITKCIRTLRNFFQMWFSKRF